MSTPMSWGDLCDPGLPDHDTEMVTGHLGRPTPAEAVNRGVTAASGEGNGTVTGDGL